MTEPRTTGETWRASPKEEAEALGERRLALEERAEEEAAGALATTLEELLALDAEHRRAHEKAYAAEAPVQSVGVFTRTFAQELRDWFRAASVGSQGGSAPTCGRAWRCRSATR